MEPQMDEKLRLADEHRINGRYDEAQPLYEALIAEDPGLAKAHWGLAHVLMNIGEFERALDHFHRCCELEPSNQRFLYDCAMMQTMLSMFDEAKALFERVISLDPNSPLADEARKQLAYY
ncbi:MAG: tetratricopeptide repeat protein [Armatimonadetes bacterium]|nr:tetratricopeptide repeat protein [Armatimonadota bacterium]